MSMASGAAAGATEGASFGPWGAVIGGVAGGLLGSQDSSAAGGASAPGSVKQPMMFTDNRFDSSGWVVATSGSSAEGHLSKSDSGMSPQLTNDTGYRSNIPEAVLPAAAFGSSIPALASSDWTMYAIVAVVAFLIFKK